MILTTSSQRWREVLFPLLLVYLFCAVTSDTFARQNHADTLKARYYFQQGDSLLVQARNDSSIIYFKKAAREYRRAKDWDRLIDAYLKNAVNYVDRGDYNQANNMLDKSKQLVQQYIPEDRKRRAKIYRVLGRINEAQSRYAEAMEDYNQGLSLLSTKGKHRELRASLIFYIGDLHNSRGEYEKALEHYFNALDIYNRTDNPSELFTSKIYNSLGNTYKNKGEPTKALDYLNKSISIDKRKLGENHPNVAKSLNNIAIIYYYRADYQRALDYMKEATRILSIFWGENHPKVAMGYNNISIVYSEMEELEKAINYMRQSIAIKKRTIGEENTDVAIGYQNLGALYFDLKQYEHAIQYYHRALNLHQKIFDGPHPEIANIYANLGEVHSKRSEFGQALDYLHKDLEMNTELLGEDHPFIADTYNKIGNAYYEQGQFISAYSAHKQAITILSGDNVDETGVETRSLDNVTHPVFLLEALEGMGKTQRSLYVRDSGNYKDQLREALNTYLEASSLIRKMQLEFRSDESKLVLSQKAHPLYRAGLETARLLFRQTSHPQYLQYALYFAEQSKARVLLEQLIETGAKNYAGLPDSVINKEQLLREKITSLNRSIREKTGQKVHVDSVHVTQLQDSLFTLKRKLRDHIKSLEQEYPKYHQLKYRDVTLTPERIQNQLLEPNQTMIEYVVGKQEVYALVINSRETSLHRIEVDSSFNRSVRTFRAAVTEGSSNQFLELSTELYKKLIAPLRPSISGNSLIIIPDGILNYLPFEALVTKPGKGNDFSNLSYLLREFQVSYAPSARYLKFWDQYRRVQKSNREQSLLAFAPVFSSLEPVAESTKQERGNRPFSPLPLSRYEVQQVDSIVSSQGYSSKVVLNASASEKRFKESSLPTFDMIHLATHAFMAGDSLVDPGIYFADKPGAEEDGILHLEEIYNLDLQAQLVVLSACETGLGELVEGEGVMSLARAFQYAGAQNLLVSLWNVDDRSTTHLMIEFYKSLHQNNSMQDAVRQAKLHLMEHPRYASPRFWAPFVLLGK